LVKIGHLNETICLFSILMNSFRVRERLVCQSETDIGKETAIPMATQSGFFGHSSLEINAAVFDFDLFDHLTMGDMDLQQEVLQLFREQLATTVSELRQQPDARSIQSNMHTLRGSAAAVGATAIVELAKQWEARTKEPLNHELVELVQQFSERQQEFFAETDRILGPKLSATRRHKKTG
jgi:HPt (histidine-containing phosphotransfer) domain-containing protein